MGDVLGLVSGLREAVMALGELDFDVVHSFEGLTGTLESISLADRNAATVRNELLVNAVNGLHESLVIVANSVETAAAAASEQTAMMGNIVAKLEELRTMLETRSVAETTAANTRSASEQALLNAIENVLGGSYEP